jgi:hypothetical protein
MVGDNWPFVHEEVEIVRRHTVPAKSPKIGLQTKVKTAQHFGGYQFTYIIASTAIWLSDFRSSVDLCAPTVPDAVKCFDHIEINIANLEFFAQPLYVSIYRPIVDVDLIVVSSVHQCVAAFYNTRPHY